MAKKMGKQGLQDFNLNKFRALRLQAISSIVLT